MDNSTIQPNGAVSPETSDPRVQELQRQNQALQHLLAEMEREKEQTSEELEKLRVRYEECRILLRHYVMKEHPSETWENLHLEQGTPIADLIAEFEK